MQGLYINNRRPATKKEVRETLRDNPEQISIENTSMFEGSDFHGMIVDLPEGSEVTIVGPDPFTKRDFYATIKRKNGALRLS